MKKRQIIGAGIWVSPVTLGTMTFGNPVRAGDAAELVRHALDAGVNSIDTANMYEGYDRVAGSAGGVAESIVGEALRGRRGDAVIATKVGMKVGGAPEDEGTSAPAVRKQLHASLARLQTGYVDVYYLHRPDAPELLDDTLLELARCLRDGAIRCYGVSNYSALQLRALLDAARALGVPPPAACQPPLSLLKTGALDELIPLCAAEGISVMPYQVYEGGLLTGKYRRGAPPPKGSRRDEMPAWLAAPDGAAFDRLEALEADAARMGLDLAGYALRWALGRPAVASAVVGAKNAGQLDAAVAATA